MFWNRKEIERDKHHIWFSCNMVGYGNDGKLVINNIETPAGFYEFRTDCSQITFRNYYRTDSVIFTKIRYSIGSDAVIDLPYFDIYTKGIFTGYSFNDIRGIITAKLTISFDQLEFKEKEEE